MADLLQQLLNGDARALARVITRVENRSAESFDILKELFQYTGRSRIIGITGSPGVGKSSLVDRLAAAYRDKGQKPAVVAVDPSSPFTGGAILGDRIRMNALAADSGVFIRSMATRGNLGGLAAATSDVVSVLDAASKDPILVETVGVGQDEIDIVKLADVCIVVLVPGMGDDVQALKAGIMEIGDVFVINKSDRPGADKMERTILALLSLSPRRDGWTPPVVRTVATEAQGTPALVDAIEVCDRHLKTSGVRLERKREAARQRLITLLQERLVKTALDRNFPAGLETILDKIVRREADPYTVVDGIVGV
jgi:LAO/AO transport system kinase